MLVPDEIIDVVDRSNQVVGQKSRAYVHKHGLLHRSVHGLLFNSDRQLFLQKRTRSKKVNPGLWESSVGGHLHTGEAYEEALVRETKEELNFIPEDYRFLFELPSKPITGHEFIRVYEIRFNGEININQEEVCEGKWFCQAELDALIGLSGEKLTSTFRLIYRIYSESKSVIGFENSSFQFK